jgi:hypothetical protein
MHIANPKIDSIDAAVEHNSMNDTNLNSILLIILILKTFDPCLAYMCFMRISISFFIDLYIYAICT